jgi:hypothetical protein
MRFDQKRGNQPIPTTRRVAYPRTHNSAATPPDSFGDESKSNQTKALSVLSERCARPIATVRDTHIHARWPHITLALTHGSGSLLVTRRKIR